MNEMEGAYGNGSVGKRSTEEVGRMSIYRMLVDRQPEPTSCADIQRLCTTR